MASIDERVVRLHLDGKQFQSEAMGVTKSLDTLKQKLNLKGADSGIKEVDRSIKSLDISPISKGIDAINNRFSAMGVAAMTVVSRMTNGTITAAHRMVSEMTRAIREGFAEYETQMNSVQTIMANTASKGTNLQQVNHALSELNTYADKTIYNFTEMTRNIGTFTAAGVDLRTSVSAIQGIANLAAVSGSSSQQASTAMYQLSQALATGTVRLMDWNSVVNAGMGGEVFQQALIRTSEHLNTGAKNYIEAEGSFRDSLEKGWLTTEVLTETLNQFSLAVDTTEQYNNAIKDLVSQGYTQEEAKSIADMAKTAGDAATKVKTFSQLIDTLKEALGSGWAQTWQTVIGDFEEAKELWTSVSDVLSNLVNDMSDSRNKLLKEGLSSGWSQLVNKGIADVSGFENIVKETAKSHGVAVDDIIKKNGSFQKSLKDGWVSADILKESISKAADGMSKMSAEQLKAQGFTSQNVADMQKLNEQFKNGSLSAEDFANKMSRISGREHIIQGLGNAFSALGSIFKQIGKAYREIFPPMTGDQLYSIAERFHKFTEGLKPTAEQLDQFKRMFKGVFAVFDIGKQALEAFVSALNQTFGGSEFKGILGTLLEWGAAIGDFLTNIDQSIRKIGVFQTVANALGTVGSTIAGWVGAAAQGFSTFGSKLAEFGSSAGHKALEVLDKVGEAIGKIAGWVKDNISAGDIFAGLAGGGIFAAAMQFKDTMDTISEAINSFFGKTMSTAKAATASFKTVLSDLHDALIAFTQGIQAFALVEIAAAIMLMASALRKIGDMRPDQISMALGAIVALTTDLSLAMKSLGKTMDKYDTKGIGKTAFVMLALAKSIDMLADSMAKIAKMSWEDLAKGLTGVGVAMFEMSKAMQGIGKSNQLNIKDAIMLIAMAKAIEMIADPLKKMSTMSWDEVARGLVAMGGALSEMSGIMILLGKFGKGKIKAAASILLMAQSLGDIADAFVKISKPNWDKVGSGLVAMGGALSEMSGIMMLLGRFGKGKIKAAASVVLMSKSLGDIADAFNKFAQYDWGTIKRGLTAMGGALGEVAVVAAGVGKIAGMQSVIGSVSVKIVTDTLPTLADAFSKFAFYDWESIGKGLVAMGGALGEVGLVAVGVGKFGKLSGLLGGASVNVTVKALDELGEGFGKFTDYDWDQIGKGLVAMGGALGEVGLVTIGLGKLSKISGLFGGANVKLAVKSLAELGEGFGKFTKFNWGEIGRGLVAMGGAMGEVGLITIGVGKLAGLSGVLGAATIALATQTLPDLAEGFGKFTKFSWDEIGKGLVAMGGALLEVGGISGGLGVLTNIGGLLGAAAIWTAIQGLDDLANALKKFGDMDWDEIGRGLTAMGGALGEVAAGSLLSTLGWLGAQSIATVAGPLGQLADSVKKWSDVKLPDGLANQLGQVADGVRKWTFANLGAGALSTAAGPVGTLADSVKKWANVTVPDGLPDQLKKLADGVGSFWSALVGSWSMSISAEPIGQLADSVKKWNGVKVPDKIGDNLKKLGDGVKAFTWGFMGGFSMGTVIGPLGDLAGSVKKWKGVELPEGLESGLKGLSAGLSGWKWLFLGGWSMATVIGPLADLAGSVSKWKGVSVPSGLKEGLANLADGVGKFWNKWSSGGNIASIADPLYNLATAVGKWNDITIPENLKGDLEGIADAVGAFSNVSQHSEGINISIGVIDAIAQSVGKLSNTPIGATALSIENFVSTLNNLPDLNTTFAEGVKGFSDSVTSNISSLSSSIDSNSETITSKLDGMVSGITSSFDGAKGKISSGMSGISTAITEKTSGITSALSGISTAISSFANNLGGKFNAVVSAMGSGLDKTIAKIKSYVDPAKSAATSVSQAVVNGLKSKASGFENTFNGGMKSAVEKIKGYRSSFYDAGSYVAAGLAAGMKANINSAAQAAAQLAAAASKAAKDELGVQSPSRVFKQIGKFVGEGFSIGMNRTEKLVARSAMSLSDSAIGSVRSAMNGISKEMTADVKYAPSIHPVIDTSHIKLQNEKLADIVARGNASIRSVNQGITGIGQVVSTNSMLSQYQSDVKAGNKSMLHAIDGMREELSTYASAIENQETAMYVDSKKLASSIAKPMNQQLGTLSRRQRLG